MKMTAILPIDIRDLLHGKPVESARVEFKASWSEQTGFQVLKTICAFANDYQNLNGGYVILGVAEAEGRAVLPPKGLGTAELGAAQSWILGRCRAMNPPYVPVLSPEVLDGRDVLVVWAPASDDRPHRARDGPRSQAASKYWIRTGSHTVNAESAGRLEALLEQTARAPWDDRVEPRGRIEDLREARVREHLHDVHSALRDEPDIGAVYRRMRLTAPVNDHEAPRNVGLLFFSDDPERWFPGARIDVVRFAADRAGEVQGERVFRGALSAQIKDCLQYLEGLSQTHRQKERDRSQVRGWVSYPLPALREVLVNAVYHRSYRPDVVEPTKVCLYPDRMEVVSYPGPVAGIEAAHLAADTPAPPAPARNRRIGELLKQLRLAETWGTGLPRIYRSMAENGSPVPRFDFDRERTWFRATLPAHPEYSAISALQDAAYLRTVGSIDDAFRRVGDAWRANEASTLLAAEMIRLHAGRDEVDRGEAVFRRFANVGPKSAVPHLANVLAETLLDHGRMEEARGLLDEFANSASSQDAVDAAILARRLRQPHLAHRYFDRAGSAAREDPRALHEFAQTKINLAQEAYKQRRHSWRDVNRRLLTEAKELLERVTQMDAAPVRHAWVWRDLARTLGWLRAPDSEVVVAFGNAQRLLPAEARFRNELERYLETRGGHNRTTSANRRNRRQTR